MDSFANIIGLWPSPGDIAEDCGVKRGLIALWRHRNNIPSEYWILMVAGAKKRKIKGITCDMLAAIAHRRAA